MGLGFTHTDGAAWIATRPDYVSVVPEHAATRGENDGRGSGDCGTMHAAMMRLAMSARCPETVDFGTRSRQKPTASAGRRGGLLAAIAHPGDQHSGAD
jgi:hypothetical protein